jgi:hypothetical protein
MKKIKKTWLKLVRYFKRIVDEELDEIDRFCQQYA